MHDFCVTSTKCDDPTDQIDKRIRCFTNKRFTENPLKTP